MRKEAIRARLWRLLSAGAILGAIGIVCTDAAQAQENPDGGRMFRRSRFGFKSRSERARDSFAGIQQVQNEQDPAYERADDKERPFENPGAGAAGANQESSAPPYLDAADKEKAPEPPGPEAWTLTNLFDDGDGGNFLKENGFKLSGFSAWGYQNAPDGSFDGHGPFLTQQGWGQFNLNQQYLFIEKIADGKDGLDWGVRFDTMYGTQAFEGQAFGNINPGHWDYLNGFDHGVYNWSLPQFYGEIAIDERLSIKGGHFYTIVGYEVVPTTGNFFTSKQLTFYNSEPFNHTGALATYKASDKLTLLAGWTLGWDTGFYQFNSGNNFLGGFSYKPDDKTDIVYAMAAGNFGWRGQGAINSVILSRKWTEKLTTVHQFDVFDTNLRLADGTIADFNTAAGGFTARDSVALINYAFYDINKWLRAGIRYEWYKPDGTSYNTLTGGVNIKPTDWLLIRPEARGMWSPGNQQIYTGAHGYSGQLFNQTVFGIDAIILF